jgi:predicted acetyltransferase
MWRLCFPDSTQNFRTFYFNKVYRHEETLILTENAVPVASFQMIPYRIKIANKIYPAAYISGVMTHPDFQGKGYMGKLLNYALEETKRKNIPITFLIPQEEQLFNFYAKHGYQKAFPWNSDVTTEIKEKRKPENNDFVQYKTMDEINSEGLRAIYSIYSQFLNKKEKVVIKTMRQFSNILEDLFLDNGSVFAGKNEITFAIPGAKGSSIVLKECFCDPDTKNDFLSAIAGISGKKEITELNSSSGTFSHYWGMIRLSDESITIDKDIYMNTMLN